jgi:hypothetical protein
MGSDSRQIQALKYILENYAQPGCLDSHPWARSLLAGQVQDGDDSPGHRLVTAIARLFAESMPAIPPRQGKRLDTRWGESGLLAAQYFAPILHGAPVPASLRDAWGRIDQSILLFVSEKPEGQISPAEKETYKLVAGEPEIAPHSTLSDWHRKGLQRLLEAMIAREAYLAKTLSSPAVISAGGSELDEGAPPDTSKSSRPRLWLRMSALLLTLALLGILLVGGWKAYQVYEQAMQLRQDAAALQAMLRSSDGLLERARLAGPAISAFREDFTALKNEVEPYLWITPTLGWLPDYGGELSASQDLLLYADALLASVDLASQAMTPLLEQDDPTTLPPDQLVAMLAQAEPQLTQAQSQLNQALLARARLRPETFSPQSQRLIVEQVDPLTGLMQDGLTLAIELPRALGASPEGPKTYLLLAQNEDELRPTGGFITAAGTVLLQDGRISKPIFVNSGYLDDWSKPYPIAPWQLNQYMNSPVLVLRDATWFTHYPTTALYAEQLYSYVSGHSVDGVIAFNQQFVVALLRLTGPLQVPGEETLVSAGNVITFMRDAKQPSEEERADPDWDNKLFLTELATVLLDKILSGQVPWERLGETLATAMDERSLLVQMDNPTLADYLSRRGWDGAVRPGAADFLLVADSNIGFNKTNALVETSIGYEVDLRTLLAPTAVLSVTHQNNSPEMFTCVHWNYAWADKWNYHEKEPYPVSDCYWNYMRVYRPVGTELIDDVSQFIPANWMLNYNSVPPRVDVLNDEEIAGVQAFGTLKVVRGGESIYTAMRFALPLNVLQVESQDGLLGYRLKIQKQPGTLDVPVQIRVYLPLEAVIYRVPEGASIEGNTVTYQARLQTDLFFDVLFYPP